MFPLYLDKFGAQVFLDKFGANLPVFRNGVLIWILRTSPQLSCLFKALKKKKARLKNLETEIGVILASPRKRSKNWDCNTQWKVLAAHCNVPTRQSQLLEKNPTSRILSDSIPCRKGPTRSSDVRSSFGGRGSSFSDLCILW